MEVLWCADRPRVLGERGAGRKRRGGDSDADGGEAECAHEPFVGNARLRAVPQTGDATLGALQEQWVHRCRDEENGEVRERVVEEHDRVVA